MKDRLLTFSLCVLFALLSAAAVWAAEKETYSQSLVNAKANADAPTNWVAAYADMVKVSGSGSVGTNPYGLKYYGDPVNNQLIVRTLSKSNAYNGAWGTTATAGNNYTAYGSKTSLSTWVTTGKEITGFIDVQGLAAGTAVKGLERGLGMSDSGTHDAIFEMAVTVGNTANPYLLRPTRNPDPATYSTNPADYGTHGTFPANAQVAGIGTGAAADAIYTNYKAAYANWAQQSHSDPLEKNRFPWTELGYTYYWGQVENVPAKLADVQGMSEFILLGGTGSADPAKTPSGTDESGKVVVVGIYSSQSYLYTKNNGTSLSNDAGAQYGNGFASFNVTGACDTLWAGAAFQTGAHLNAASPNTITVGPGGSISGGQGILVGSQNYTVTNAGLITANENTKKFNLPGSENIALLFKGDTHSNPYTGAVKNILINSGTITAPGTNGTAVAAWAGNTDITNTGTIAGSGYAILTGAGNDTVTVNGGELSGRVDLGSGTDSFTVTPGGNARLRFTLNKDTAATAAIANVETVTIADNTILAANVAGTKNISNNDRFLIADTNTLSVTPANLTILNDSSLPMISFFPVKSGNKLYLVAARNGTYYTTNSGNTSLGIVLDSLANTATGDMSAVLAELDKSGSAANARQLEPLVNYGVIQAGNAAIRQFNQTIVGRIEQLPAVAQAQENMMTDFPTGANQANTGTWTQVFGSTMHQDGQNTTTGYNATVDGVSAGWDRLLAGNIFAGFSFGYAHSKITSADYSTKTSAESYSGSLYGSLTAEAYYLDAILSFAYNRYDSSRNISFGSISRTATASYDGNQYSGYLEGGYNLHRHGLKITPLASLQYLRIQLNDYSESGAGALNLTTDTQRYNVLQSGLGAKIAYPIREKDAQLIPELHALWLYDFSGDPQQTTSKFTGGGASFATRGLEPAQSSYNIGAKLHILTEYGVTLSLDYDLEIKESFHSHSGYINVRYEF